MSETVDVEREIILEGGPRDGMVIKTSQRHSIEVAFIEDSKAIRCNPDEPKPWTEIKTVRYRSARRYSSIPVDLIEE